LSKKFTSDCYDQAPIQEATFEMMWPQLQPKVYSSSFQQSMKEFEAKALKQAKEKALFIEKEAYERGFAQGEKDGLEMGQKRLEAILLQFKNILLEIERQREDLYRTYEKEMLQLVLSLSKKILHREVSLHENIILTTLQEALQYLVDRKKVIIHLNPADYQYLLTHPESSPLALGDQGKVRVIEDHSITRGGCFLETPFGKIDATIESQFEEIVSLIWKHMETSSSLSERSNP
jgi:flagellar assembly protein FliH